MPRPSHGRTLALFGVLAAYVLLQFIWWAYLLVQKDNELQALLGQLDALGVSSTVERERPGNTLLMVAGEGFVFVTLLLLALWLTYRSVRHELLLARLQHNFLLATSHELRTPIAAMKLHLQTIERRRLDDDQRSKLMAAALSDVDRLSSLSEKILLAARLEELRLPLGKEAIDLTGLLRTMAERAQQGYGREHVINASIPDGLKLTGDAEALRTIVGNLLENACKYAGPGTTITLACEQDHHGVLLTVADEGPGIAPEDRARIFDRFYRGGQEETRTAKGTGLGLFIVQRLVNELGGRVEHRPREPHGAIFAVQLPER
jgi:signal transduction histidine kinase